MPPKELPREGGTFVGERDSGVLRSNAVVLDTTDTTVFVEGARDDAFEVRRAAPPLLATGECTSTRPDLRGDTKHSAAVTLD